MMAERDPVTVRLQNIAQAVLHFAKVDSDDSTSIGVITKKEMIDFFDGHPCINASEEFDKLNKNKDGCITLDEIDDISKDDLKALQAIGGSPYIKAALEARPAPKKQESKKKEPAKKATKKKK